jgi:hypothetical protein
MPDSPSSRVDRNAIVLAVAYRAAGDKLAAAVEHRWTGPGVCACDVCTAAAEWRALRAKDDG